jgi:hypothetical protein
VQRPGSPRHAKPGWQSFARVHIAPHPPPPGHPRRR